MYDKRKREEKKQYFHAQRIHTTGYFTEYITRVYYNILKQVIEFDGYCCPQRSLNLRALTYDIYKGIYAQPDHDAYGTIRSCLRELVNMGYIHEEEINDQKYFVVDKELDYLLEGEHEKYIKKYNITKDYEQLQLDIDIDQIEEVNSFEDPQQSDLLSCNDCQGHYHLRKGRYGYFYGCNNYPKCRSTRKVSDITYEMLLKKGLAIYEVEMQCWKCHQNIKIISYFPYFDLCKEDPQLAAITNLKIVRLSVLERIDKKLKTEYPHIKDVFSQKAGFEYPANTCEYCGALQGSTLALEKMFHLLDKETQVQKHIIKYLPMNNTTLTKQEWEELWNDLHEII